MLKIGVQIIAITIIFISFTIIDSYNFNSYRHINPWIAEGFSDPDNKWLCLFVGFCSIHSGFSASPGLTPVFQWSQLEFDYPNPGARQSDIDSGVFIPGVPAPIDMDVYYAQNHKNRIFVTIPRFQPGIPVTLGTVSDKFSGNNPVITPYPSWHWHQNPKRCNSQRIVSVYRVQIDECGRLWVLDTGKFGETQTCPPQILAFDLKTNQLLHKYEIPASQLESRSVLVTPIVDVRDPHLKCKDTFVYAADCQTYSIIVYDVRRDVSWRVTDKTMYPYPNYGTFNIQGDSFDLMDGILGMAITPFKPGEDRRLFYHALSGPTENWVYTSDLRNQTRFLHDHSSSPEIFHTFRQGRNTQSAAEAIDKNGIMYFGQMTDVILSCWNTNSEEYGPKTIDTVSSNKETLQFASGLKIITNKGGVQELWVMTSRFQKVATGTINPQETNFRIQAGKVDDLIFSTKCKQRQGHNQQQQQQQQKPNRGGGYGLIKPGNIGSSGY